MKTLRTCSPIKGMPQKTQFLPYRSMMSLRSSKDGIRRVVPERLRVDRGSTRNFTDAVTLLLVWISCSQIDLVHARMMGHVSGAEEALGGRVLPGQVSIGRGAQKLRGDEDLADWLEQATRGVRKPSSAK